MSKIDELIRELCPKGVKRVALSHVAHVEKGRQVNREILSDDFPYPVYNGGVSPSGRHIESNFPADTITVSQGGASAGYVSFVREPLWVGAHCYAVIPKPEILNRFLFFYLKMLEGKLQGSKYGAGIPALDKRTLTKLSIPLPPIEVQREIVSILDAFTQLEAELEAELEARRMQHEETRKSLIMAKGSRVVPLSKIAAYSQLRVASNGLTSSNFVGVDNLNANKGGVKDSGFVPSYGSVTRFLEGDVLLGNIRPYLRKIWFADRPGGCSGDVLCIRLHPETKDQVNPRYLYHCLASEEFFEYAVQTSKGAKMPRGDKASILKYPVHVPSLTRQSEVVSILDKLDVLVHDVTMGIPAEIAARRKQYEYYRNKLLTFKELESA